MSPANLSNPFGESCCDGGSCADSHESARPCGCDYGANHLCAHHLFKEKALQLVRKWRFDASAFKSAGFFEVANQLIEAAQQLEDILE